MVRYIFSQHNHFDADQLIDDMKQKGFRVSRATVYRTLDKLVDAGLLRRLEIGPRMYYEHDYGYPQHEHLHLPAVRQDDRVSDPGHGGDPARSVPAARLPAARPQLRHPRHLRPNATAPR